MIITDRVQHHFLGKDVESCPICKKMSEESNWAHPNLRSFSYSLTSPMTKKDFQMPLFRVAY